MHRAPHEADAPARQWLYEAGFLTVRRSDSPDAFLPPVTADGGQPHGYVMADPAHAERARELVGRLNRITGEPGGWRVLPARQPELVLSSLPRARGGRRPVVFHLADTEDTTFADEVVRTCDVLWAAETAEGTFLGPLFRTDQDVARYRLARASWSDARRLRALGCPAARPLPLARHLQGDIEAFARAMLAAVDSAPDHCRLLGDVDFAAGAGLVPQDGADEAGTAGRVREAALWTEAIAGRIPPERLESQHTWSLGMLRDLRVVTATGWPGVRIGTCRAPAGGVDALEGNSGKALSDDGARTGTIGEAVERTAAWLGSRPVPRPIGRARVRPLDQFHPHGEEWDKRAPSSRGIEWTTATDLASGEPVAVPRALVDFPYRGPDRPTRAVTTGLAVYPSRRGALLRAVREVLERDDLYDNFLHLRPALRLDPAALAPRPRDVIRDGVRGDWYLLMYPGVPARLPVVHGFFHDPRLGAVARGTGTGLNLAEAAHRAVLETVQVHCQFQRGVPALSTRAYADWSTPEVVQEVTGYLASHPYACPDTRRWEHESDQLDSLVAACDTGVLAVSLPSPVMGWHAVRVLIPGALTIAWPSDSAAGRRLKDAVWQHGLPT